MKQVTGTREWAASNYNIALGCSHGCRYCYASSMAVRFGRATPSDWTSERILASKVAKRWRKVQGRIMFPTTHDITPVLLEAATTTLVSMLGAGNEVLIVSKPHLECIQSLCSALLAWRGQVTFRFTIGSTRDDVLRLWEPGAPCLAERLASLRHAHQAGYATSISCEPMLDDDPDALVAATAPYVTDSIWLGKANMLGARLAHNAAPDDVRAAAHALAATQTNDRIRALYGRLHDHPLVRWKESIKTVLGLDLATSAGLDI